MSELAPEEAALYAFRRNVVIAASAGTGKTHRLTALYVLLSLGFTSMGEKTDDIAHEAIEPSRIVATTFSRAAANEIRSRVEKALRLLAESADGPPFLEILEDRARRLGADLSRFDLRERASKALLGWHGARIDTLHGVAADIVREHALALGVSPRARVEEDDEGRALITSVVDEVLGQALSEGGARMEAARSLVASGGGVVPARDHLATLFARMDEDGVATSELSLTDHLGEARRVREELERIARTCAHDGNKKIAPAATELQRALASNTGLALGEDARRALVTLFGVRKAGEDKMSPGEHALVNFKDRFGDASMPKRAMRLVRLLAEAPELRDRENGMIELLGQVRAAISLERRQRGVLSFGDLLRLARNGLRDDLDVSRVVRASIDVLMVDELQDTSSVQRDLVYLLRERSDSGRKAGCAPSSEGLERSGLFIVGDRKQSIYGFRGADVAVFSRVAAELAGRPAAEALDLSLEHANGDPSADFLALRESRRSGASIVSFVNAFSKLDFTSDRMGHTAPRDFEVSYSEAEHLTSFKGDSGDRVYFLRDDGDPAPASEPLLIGDDPSLREAFVAAAFADHMCGALGMAYRDVALLARRRSTIPLVELALGRLGLPYVVAGRALYEASEVRDLAALIRLVLDPRDRHSLATVLRGPLVGLSDAALLSLCEAKGLSRELLSADGKRLDPKLFVEEGGRLRDFRDRFLALREPLLRLAPGEALRAALSGFDLDRIISALPRAQARLGNVDRVVGIARERGGTLIGFSRFLDRQIADETDEAEAAVFSQDDDAIRLTTIHASKGLDFEAVVLLDLDSAPRATPLPIGYDRGPDGEPRFVVQHKGERGIAIPSRVWDEAAEGRKARELAERKRLTYVAITRAKTLLALVGRVGAAKSGSAYQTLLVGRETKRFPDLVEMSASDLLFGAFGAEAMRLRPLAAPPEESRITTPSLPRRLPTVERLPIATTPLGVFRGCPRRFRLRFLLGLEEPVATGQLELFEVALPRVDDRVERSDADGDADIGLGSDPRVLGRAAHRVLELLPHHVWGSAVTAESVAVSLVDEGLGEEEGVRLAPHLARIVSGAYAQTLSEDGIVLHREEELVWDALGSPALSLRGTVDLFVERPGGLVDVIDYKLARPSNNLDRYAFQLKAYALALSRSHPGSRVRAGILFLEGGEEPVWLSGSGEGGALSESDHDGFAAELEVLGLRLAVARTSGVFPPIAVDGCRALHCGFVTACHKPDARGGARKKR